MSKRNRPIEVEDEDAGTVFSENAYTYVGSGADSPSVINFMGLQKFVRGHLTEVTDPVVLAKIATNKCFVNREVEQEELFDMDALAAKEAEAQIAKDLATNRKYQKKHSVE